MADHTAKQRVARWRQRQRTAGLVRLTDIWAHPEDIPKIKRLVEALNRARSDTRTTKETEK